MAHHSIGLATRPGSCFTYREFLGKRYKGADIVWILGAIGVDSGKKRSFLVVQSARRKQHRSWSFSEFEINWNGFSFTGDDIDWILVIDDVASDYPLPGFGQRS
jgi:hypothetical protein